MYVYNILITVCACVSVCDNDNNDTIWYDMIWYDMIWYVSRILCSYVPTSLVIFDLGLPVTKNATGAQFPLGMLLN